MILGLSTATFTLIHVLISLIGIGSGFVALGAMIGNKWSTAWNTIFLTSTVATSATGFFFHSKSFGPPHVIGLISLTVLALILFALYQKRLAGRWQSVYTIGAAFALYLNVFVGIVQAFQKVPALHAMAPTQSEGPFVAAQCAALLLFVAFTYLAVKRLSPVPRPLAMSQP
jgi:hypothetical protein